MRTDPYKSGPHFARNHFGTTYRRDTIIKESIEYFNEAVRAKSGTHEGATMLATLASRGCGKSHIVDQLCTLRDSPHLFPGRGEFLVPVSVYM